MRTQVDFGVAQELPPGQLGERHGKELIYTGRVFDLVFAFVIGPTASATKRVDPLDQFGRMKGLEQIVIRSVKDGLGDVLRLR